MPRAASPTHLWAIAWSNPGGDWLDYTSVSRTRSEALAKVVAENATDKWRREVKRRRRLGTIRAVRVVLMTEGVYHERCEQPARQQRVDRRTLDLFETPAT